MTTTYTMSLKEDELLFIRKALCDKNMKHVIKALEYDRDGYEEGAQLQRLYRNIGNRLVKEIDSLLSE